MSLCRRLSCVLVLGIVFAGASLAAARAGAQESASAESLVPAPVLALLRRGVDARVHGDDAGALAAFEEAHALAPELGRVTAQLGLAHQALGHWLEAEALLERGLASDDPWIGRNREAIEGSLAIVRGHLATLEITAPAGASVRVDDEPEGQAPPRSVRVVEGTHRLRASLAGHRDAEASLDARGGRVEHVILDPPTIAGTTTSEGAPTELATTLVDPTVPDPTVPDPTGSEGPDRDGHDVDALVWAGLAASLVGVGAAIGGHVLAEDARGQRVSALASECPTATPSCSALRDQFARELAPYEVVVNVAWGLTALGGVLAAVGIGLTLGGDETSATVRLTPLGVEGRF
ncbi:MAG: PEGA domain-containing protein [Sandaracinaceae bacterium]|nr:PEGA domain-containing protein [Sandaracinaceae bacterium]